MKKLYIYFVFCAYSQFSNAQDVLGRINDQLQKVKKGEGVSYTYTFNSSNEREALNLLDQYAKDHSDIVRVHVYKIKSSIRDQTKDSLIRQQVTLELVKALISETESNTATLFSILQRSRENDFNSDARKSLELAYEKRISKELLLIIGIAQAKMLVPKLQLLASSFDRRKRYWEANNAWFASLALARMGNATNVDTLIAAVELENDLQKRVYVLLNDLAYTRHPDAIKLLRKYLASTEIMPKISAAEGMSVYSYAARYIVRYLSDYLVNFPVKKSYLSLSPEDYQKIITYFEEEDKKVRR